MLDKKQGSEKTEFVKDANSEKEAYVFQKNKKTKLGASFIVVVLVVIVAAILLSFFYFQTPA